MLAVIESGWVQKEIQESAYQYQRSIEDHKRVVVGVNEFRSGEDGSIPIHTIDPALEPAQIQQLRMVRQTRDQNVVQRSLDRLHGAAQGDENLMPFILNAVEAYVTVGEISDVFRRAHGEFQEALGL
jgi:methylmalonyl-CoA mutase N-terminal domain/subunit